MTATRKAILQEMIRTNQLEIIHIEAEETKQANTLESLVTLGPIQGYTETEHARKEKFHSLARRKLRRLANALGLSAKDYDLRSNKAGPAVSGEITLHTDTFYCQVSDGCMGRGREILFRKCDGRRDYSGGQNHFADIAELDDPEEFAMRIRAYGQFGFLLPDEAMPQ